MNKTEKNAHNNKRQIEICSIHRNKRESECAFLWRIKPKSKKKKNR